MATLAATIGRGTLASRPATMPVGSLYYVTDTSTLYRSNGAGWDSIEAAVTGYGDEQARDAIAAALTPGAGITISANDPADTITIAATGAVVGTHTHTGADVTDFAEVTDDRLASLLVAGSGISLTYNDAANTLTIAASAAAPVPMPIPGWVSGSWYGLQETFPPGTAGPAGLLANRLYAVPLAVPKATTVDRIGINVTTLVAASLIRLGIYSPAANGMPGALLLDAGTVSSATTGSKEITISQALAAGWYWLACVSGHTPSVNSLASIFGQNVIGQTGTGGTGKSLIWISAADATAVTALPSTFNVATATGASSSPLPMVRAA